MDTRLVSGSATPGSPRSRRPSISRMLHWKRGVQSFSDTMSGARYDRPGLAALMEYVPEGDTVVVSLGQLAPFIQQEIRHSFDGSGPPSSRAARRRAAKGWFPHDSRLRDPARAEATPKGVGLPDEDADARDPLVLRRTCGAALLPCVASMPARQIGL